MKTASLATAALALAVLGASASAATISYGTAAPATGPDGVSNLVGATTDSTNVSGGANNNTYVAQDQFPLGQTFTTGGNVGGYLFSAFSFQHVGVGIAPPNTFYNTEAAGGATISVRVTRPLNPNAVSTLAVLSTETAASTPGIANAFGTNPAGGSPNGTGRFLTLTLDAPVLLAPNMTYGFDIAVSGGTYFFDSNGNADPATYAGGTAYSTGSGVGTFDNSFGPDAGDHVFVANLTAVVPEPASLGLLVAGGVGLLARRRRGA